MSKNQLFGVFAYPVHHSLSPMMHNAAFAELGLPHYYHGFEVHPDHIQHAVESMRTLGLKGVNVTIPHKEKVIPFLDEVEPEALLIGAVNTIVQDSDGRLKGFNTDGAGYVRSLLQETPVKLDSARTLLLGAGGATKGIAIYLIKNGCSQITITNRTQSKAIHLQQQLEEYAATSGKKVVITSLDWNELTTKYEDYNLIINTTSLGMWPHTEQLPIQLKNLSADTIVSDIVYNPLKTKFLQEAEKLGAHIHLGLGMFIYQGAIAFEHFTGVPAPVEKMREVVLNRLQQGG